MRVGCPSVQVPSCVKAFQCAGAQRGRLSARSGHRAVLRRVFWRPERDATFRVLELEAAGDWAFETGANTLILQPPEQSGPVSLPGKYLVRGCRTTSPENRPTYALAKRRAVNAGHPV